MSDEEAAAYLSTPWSNAFEQQQQEQQQGQQQDAATAKMAVARAPAPGVFSTIEEVTRSTSTRVTTQPLPADGKFTLVNAAYLKLSAEGKQVPPCQELPDEARYKGPIDDERCWCSRSATAGRPRRRPGRRS